MSKQELYSIEFLDNERKPIVYCHFELYINGGLVTSLPPRADNNGKVWFNKELVKSTTMVHKVLELVFWSEKFPRTQHSTTDTFVWPEGKTSIKALMPDTYTIKTRALANENNEEQDYARAYYLVRKGDTWDSLEVKLGGDAAEALIFYNRTIYSGSLVEGTKLYYPLGFRTRNVFSQQVLKKKKESEKSEKKTEQKQASSEKENSQDNKKNSTIEQRSVANGKPVDVTLPKEGGCFCYRDITPDEFHQIIKNKQAMDFLEYLNEYFKKYDINTCIGKAFFIANSLHESGEYKFLEEILGKGIQEKDVYDGYKGRGVMQLTWADNYRGYGESVGENFLGDNKVRIGKEKKHAVGSGMWFWKKRELDKYAINNDLITISASINGGYNHFDERARYYKLSINALNVRFCKNLSREVISMLDNYTPFEDSAVYHDSKFIAECFGWGLWNDPGLSKKGKSKSSNEAKKGYERFLEMAKNKAYPFGYNKKKNKEKTRYGYTGTRA
ncbi:hypothetical protein, partial [Rodentibacter sp. Ppn85]|uniref:glycoside hydrolase family 19 protein n=1 Tax=Rodentibacter sp. Ppn85 TaxID=1908525 RepID=UPI0009863D6B